MATMNPGFEFNLQRLALFSISRTIWQQTKVLALIKNWYNFHNDPPFCPSKEWHKLIHKLLEMIRNEMTLPEHLEFQLCNVVKEMGIQIHDWLMHVQISNDEYNDIVPENYRQRIQCPMDFQWTPYGTIDANNTIAASWLSDPNFKSICLIYHMAVCNGLPEDMVHELWFAMTEEQTWVLHHIYKKEFAVYSYYDSHRRRKLCELKRAIQESRTRYRSLIIYMSHLTLTENLCLIFIMEGYTGAAILMWNKLDIWSQLRILEDAAYISCLRWHNPVRSYSDFPKTKWAELTIFFISRLTSCQKMRLFRNRSSFVLRIFATTWPWKGFFFQVFEEFWRYFGKESHYDIILVDIARDLIFQDAKAGFIVEGSENQQLFQQFWRCMPKDDTLKFSFNLFMAFHNLVKARDMTSARVIVNTPELASKRKKLLDSVLPFFEDMIEKNELTLLQKFMNEIFKTEREKKAFKHLIVPHGKFILKNRFDLVERWLGWQTKNEKEQIAIRLDIDYREFGKGASLMLPKTIATRFLNWQSSILENQRNGKNLNCVFSNKDTIYKVWNRWKLNVKNGEEESVEFINWFLELEYQINRVKYERGIPNELIPLLVKAIMEQRYFDIVDNLKHWCSLSEQDVKIVREKMLATSKIPIFRHCIEVGEIQISRGFLQWIEDDVEKKSFINQFMSGKGSTSCYIFIANERSIVSKRMTKFRDFINTWILPLEAAQLNQFKAGLNFQAKKTKYKHLHAYKNYETFHNFLNEVM